MRIGDWSADVCSSDLDLNTAPQELLARLMRVGGADEATADRVAAAITDWRDADDLRRPQGAEWQDYAAAGSRYRPRNGPFVALGELRAVAGMTPGDRTSTRLNSSPYSAYRMTSSD